MYVGADAVKVQGPALDSRSTAPAKVQDDPRVTPIGQWLRRWSVDELPQLWCVLKGDMSMVGPRPALPAEVACYSELDRRRLAVIPGITCIWQVSGRSDVPFAGQVALDLQYIATRNLLLDLRIVLQTIKAVLSRRGAY
jgi:lipopolysaccharide/colanic/teichoic acid biosynthesis glycosyltransferase